MRKKDRLVHGYAKCCRLCESDVAGVLVRNRNRHGVHSTKRQRHRLHIKRKLRLPVARETTQIRCAIFADRHDVRVIACDAHADIVRGSPTNVLDCQIDMHGVPALQRVWRGSACGHNQHWLGRGDPTAATAG
ncbi:hypothetical protein SDC9_76548 [bioreactor metagenome]|uniref:Uncharacterized protein n=1 Tax=bioreactor metagenome TaxID=1076179 RepID=A0A644YNB7_9ZZZZ